MVNRSGAGDDAAAHRSRLPVPCAESTCRAWARITEREDPRARYVHRILLRRAVARRRRSTRARRCAGQRHSELLLGMVDALLRRHGARGARPRRHRVRRRARARSPGCASRAASTQGLAFGAGLPVVGVSTLLALAEAAARGARRVLPRRAHGADLPRGLREERRGLERPCTRPALCAPGEVPLAAGRGARGPAAAAASRRTGRRSSSATPAACRLSCRTCIRTRETWRGSPFREFEQGRAVAAEAAAPVYLRDKVALKSDER